MLSLLHASAKRPLRLALAALLTSILMLLVAACGQGNVPATPIATNQVDLPRSYRFAPEDIAVEVGTTVTWTNNDNFTHNVHLETSEEVQLMRPGESVTHQFSEVGLYNYVCTLHPQDMTGTVLVEASADLEPGQN